MTSPSSGSRPAASGMSRGPRPGAWPWKPWPARTWAGGPGGSPGSWPAASAWPACTPAPPSPSPSAAGPPRAGRRGRRGAWVLAGGVCLARMYVGSPLPFDVVGGAALGWAAGSLVLFVLGAPDPRPSEGKLRAVLAEPRLDADGGGALGAARRRPPWSVPGARPPLFVKVVVAEWRALDLLWRAVGRLTRRDR